jgi:hypothetical protein
VVGDHCEAEETKHSIGTKKKDGGSIRPRYKRHPYPWRRWRRAGLAANLNQSVHHDLPGGLFISLDIFTGWGGDGGWEGKR